MNLSGECVRELIDYYKITPNDLIIIYDDISLEVGQLRIRPMGSAGGHNGIKNIIANLGTQEFPRIKIGVGEKPKEWELNDYVLGRFLKVEEPIIRETLDRASKACTVLIKEGIDAAMNEFTEIQKCLEKGKTPIQITGCIDSQKCHFMAGIGEAYSNRLIVTYNELKAKEIYEDLKLYDKNVYFYPAKDIIFYSADIHGNAIVAQRLRILKRLIDGDPITVVTTLDGGMDRLLPLEFLSGKVIHLKEGDTIDLASCPFRL